MNFKKIVITGGPCAGKTTGLSYIEQCLTKIGYKVVILNESATELILNGLNYTDCKNQLEFEYNIMKLQIEKEKLYERFCKKLPQNKVILICDRGIMDCKSYIDNDGFKALLERLKVDEIQIRDNYDAVFHLVTAAKGAEEFYTIENNAARYESIAEAIESDSKNMDAWIGHPHFRAIDNSTNFELKMKRLFNEICAFLGEPQPLEIERKFLIKRPDIAKLEALKHCRKVDIIQTYLQRDEGEDERRIRQRGLNGSYIYTVTTKSSLSDIKRIETERRITIEEYLQLLNDCDTTLHPIRKTRYLLMANNQYFEIDIYPHSKEHAIMEIELTNENDKISPPDFIEIVKEVTDDKSFSNRSLAEKFPDELM